MNLWKYTLYEEHEAVMSIFYLESQFFFFGWIYKRRSYLQQKENKIDWN